MRVCWWVYLKICGAVNNESAYLSLCSKSVPQISYNGLFSYTEDAIFQFHGIESKHRAFLIQGQFIPIHCEDRPAGLRRMIRAAL